MNLPLELRGLARSLRRDPAFLAASILTLGLGIGSATSVFSLVKAVVLAPLPWNEPEGLVLLWNKPPEGASQLGLSAPELAALGAARSIGGVAAFMPGGANLVLDGRARQLWVTQVNPGAFEALGVSPRIGRSFLPEDGDGVTPVILSHELWNELFGADPAAVGRRVRFDGAEREIVGVMPPGLAMPTDYRWSGQTEIWSPLSRNLLMDPDADARRLWVVARLRAPGDVPRAHAELSTIHRSLQSSNPAAYPGGSWRLDAVPVTEEVLGSARRTLAMFGVAVALVLAVTASNLALLLAARGMTRRRELAVRAALGATDRQIASHGLLEALAVATLGGATGIGLAAAVVSALPSLAPGVFPRSDRVALDAGVAVFGLLLAAVVALVVGGREARQRRRRDPWEVLVASRGVAAGRDRARRVLLALEVAVSTVLVAGASLFLQSFANLRDVPLGFRPAAVVTGDIVLPDARYPTAAETFAFFERVREAAKTLPGVEEVGWTTTVPFWNPAGTTDLEIEGIPAAGPAPIVAFESIGPGLLRAVGTDVLRGRDFTDSDREGRPLVALVNRAFEERFWPNGSALERRIRLTGGGARPWLTVVGVVEDSRDQRPSIAARPRISLPFRQLPEAAGRTSRYLSLMVRARGDASKLIAPLRAVVSRADPEVPLGAARTLSSEVRLALARPRLTARLTGSFAAAALVLVLAGLYGLLASSVSRRFREIGIRMALGAPSRSVFGLVIGEGIVPVATGLAVGLAASAGAARLTRGLLYGVGTVDPTSLLAASAAILATAALSSAVPAWRALRVDPAITLRRE